MVVIHKLYLKYIREYYALFDINLEISNGEKVAFVGGEDCGKTSLIRILAKLEKFTSGEVYIKDLPIKQIKYDLDLSVGYIPVHPIFFDRKTVYENLKYVLAIRKMDKKQIDEKINSILSNLKIENLKDMKIANLSFYERYLVSIARLSLRKIDLLLVDNVFEKLSKNNESENIKNILKEKFSSQKDLTMIVATSDKTIAKQLAKRNVYLKAGSIVEEDEM